MRRNRRRIAVGCVLLLTLVATGGCGGSEDDRGSTGENLVTETPPGKTELQKVTWMQDRETRTLDWYHAADYSEFTAIANLCESLMRVQPDLTIEPGLAEKVSNPDPKTWVYTIRKDIRFWDGSELTAEDVAYSLARNLDPDVASFWSVWYARVRSIEATGPYEVTIRLKEPDYLLPRLLASFEGIIGKKAFIQRAGDKFGTRGTGVMCTGPYELEEWAIGEGITFKRNPDYWNADEAPLVDRLEIKTISDEATATAALSSGEVDGAYRVPYPSVDQLRSGTEGNLYEGLSTQIQALHVANPDGPLGNVGVRKAFAKTIDYEALDTIYKGTGEAARAPAAPGTWGYAKEQYQQAWDDLPAPKQDLKAATAEVKRLGDIATEPIKIVFSSQITSSRQIAEVLENGAEKAGMSVELRDEPASTYITFFTDPEARKQVDGILGTNFADVADPLNLYSMMALPDGFQNFLGYDNAEVSRLLGQARATADENKRAELVIDAQEIIAEERPWIPLYAPSNLLYMNSKLTGAPPGFVYLQSPWAAALGGR